MIGFKDSTTNNTVTTPTYVEITDGTNTVGPMLAGDVNSIPTSGNVKEATYTLTGVQGAITVVGPGVSGAMTSIDTAGWASVTIQPLSFGTGVLSLTYQESADNTNFVSQGVYPWLSTSNVGNVQGAIDSTVKLFTSDLRSRYIKFTTNGTGQIAGQTQIIVTLRSTQMAKGSVVTLLGTTAVLSNTVSSGTVLASAARTTTTTSAAIACANFTKLRIYLNVSVASGTGGLQVQLLAKDPVTTTYNALHAVVPVVAITATGEYFFDYALGASATGNLASSAISMFPPSSFEVKITAGDASSYTYSVGYELID